MYINKFPLSKIKNRIWSYSRIYDVDRSVLYRNLVSEASEVTQLRLLIKLTHLHHHPAAFRLRSSSQSSLVTSGDEDDETLIKSQSTQMTKNPKSNETSSSEPKIHGLFISNNWTTGQGCALKVSRSRL